MKKENLVILVITVLIFIAFFLPWVHVESKMVGGITKVLTGKRQTEISNISGFSVPLLTNSSDARLAISVIKIFNPKVTNADKKSWLIWGVPLLAIIIFLLSLFLGVNRWFNLILAITGIIIFVFGAYELKTTDLDKLVLNARIGVGLWLTLWGYLGLGVVGGVNFFKGILSKK
ncbi:MAG: hypothetical protein NC818_06880 [Candidatus Omnitrophica bacterium]|nr:hypothetical protein [Candidatus Omnitrophota bacterium]